MIQVVTRIKAVLKLIRRLLLEPVIGYTRIVFATKYLLASLAVLLILVLILFPMLNPVHDNFRVTFSNISGLTGGESPKMLNPRFQGVDSDNQTYNITADNATKIDEESVGLENINADINMKDGSWIALVATKGIYNHKVNQIEMSEMVNIFTSNGYEFYSKTVNMNLKEKAAYSKEKIQGHGPIGNISADSFAITDNGDNVVLEGNVKLILHPNNVKG